MALALEQVRRDRRCLQPDAEAALRAPAVLLSEERLDYRDEQDRGRRRAALSAARKRLESAWLVPPEAVRDEVGRPRKRRGPRYRVGDIVAFPLGTRGLLGFARILKVGEKGAGRILLQVYKFIAEAPPAMDSLRSSGPLMTFFVFDDGIGRSQDRRIIGSHPVEAVDLLTRWYDCEPWHHKYFLMPGPDSTQDQREEATEEEVRRVGAADARIILDGILERTDQVCREFAKAGLFSEDDAAEVHRRHREFYDRLHTLQPRAARQALKEYRQTFLTGVRPWT